MRRQIAPNFNAEKERKLREQLFRRTFAASARRGGYDRRSEAMKARSERTTEHLGTLVARMSEQSYHTFKNHILLNTTRQDAFNGIICQGLIKIREIKQLKPRQSNDASCRDLSNAEYKVQQSEQTTSALIHSSSVLRESHSYFNTVSSTIRSGGKLISKYGRRETTDKILILLCLILYFGVCLYILRKRLPLFTWNWFDWFGG